ncbi:MULTISPECIES: cupin domain-containing protein [unclassified Mesorhizobium]|uniref:cupin domain-containing protein n=1 Tax=unclassified Mesorhizobium TaxID=325217 RepID=UPI000FC9C705|nr:MULTISPECIES: cupin domain-containing protein [unclassified Mesorhizobium]TGP18164.1 cupin domain-containing protein [Mesorhizobium sp. M1D.F.Ca.ET.231.01.1.1]TGP28077.1 cupin domain-containing protein [Mesorhizobium sp. M1D.F.Ca.ET.234.01.1.1]TGS38194.1 cupin domain-containing protein [Mesorhizobium sp. M1D.F.Ca.ET.184.01.1.1]TGS58290.1 cupin domain-containing protein [Mesorhizobium sp. M1D.F.Ca.ET.183.01.1.1]
MNFNVTTPEAAQTLWVVADRIRLLGGIADSSLELIEVEVPPGSGTPPHSHASPELFYVLEGTLTVRHFGAGGSPEVTVAGPGTSVRIGPRAPHNYSNDSGRPVRMLVLVEPSMIAFFRDIGTVEPQAQPDFARIGAAMQRHGIEALPAAA